MSRDISFDFNSMFDFSVGAKHGVSSKELRSMFKPARYAHCHLQKILRNPTDRIALGLEWAKLGGQEPALLRSIQRMGNTIAKDYESVISLGIGGSYLGLKAAQDALCPAYYNEFVSLRNGRPKIYFDGNNLDPDTLVPLLKNLNPRKTFVIVISKSGETTETKAAFAIVEAWLKKGAGSHYGRQIFAITDQRKGALRKRVNDEQKNDSRSFMNLPVLEGVGGRFSEFNIGLLHLAIIGVDLQELCAGVRAMAQRCSSPNIFKNPAAMYALLQTILYRKKGKDMAIIMPFSETLKSTADWYVQLLAESLGKKYQRKIISAPDGREVWQQNKNKIINVGRTPVPCRGTNDLHSIQQNNVEGENNKTVTFIKINSFKNDLAITGTNDFLSGKRYSKLLSLAQEATEWALVRNKRPNCTIALPVLNAYYWGALLFFFEMATAYEGELLNVNAFDQPGVEGYKNYMYVKLKKPGIAKEISDEISSNPLIKNSRYIL